jgi:hypothetical protein
MVWGKRAIMPVAICLMFLGMCLLGVLETASAKGTITGTVRFTDSAGVDVDSYGIGDTMYWQIEASGGKSGGMWICRVRDAVLDLIAVTYWYQTSWTATENYLLSEEDHLGDWTVSLTYTSHTGRTTVLDTDAASVCASSIGPDLDVTSVTSIDLWGSTTSVTSGQPFQVTVTVKNIGEVTAIESTFELRDGYGDSYTVLSTLSVPTLEAQMTYTHTFFDLYTSQGGAHILKGVADAAGEIQETREDNNELDNALQVNLAAWTFALYMAGDNDLEGEMIGDFCAMSTDGGGSNSDLSIVVLLDRYEGGVVSDPDWTDARCFFVNSFEPYPHAEDALYSLGEVSMGSEGVLSQFGITTFDRFKSNNRALFIKDHGNIFTCCVDAAPPSEPLDEHKIPDALASISSSIGEPIEVVGFDACYVGQLDIAFYQCHQYADFLLGCPDLSVGAVYDYENLVIDLKADPLMTAEEVANCIVDHCPIYSKYAAFAAVSGDGVGSLGASIDAMADALISKLPYYRSEIWDARLNTGTYIEQDYPDNKWNPIDIRDFALEIMNRISDSEIQASAQLVIDRVDAALASYKVGLGYSSLKALSCCWPSASMYTGTEFELLFEMYRALDFDSDTSWYDFLLRFWCSPRVPEEVMVELGGATSVALDWLPPLDDGGFDLTDYHIFRGDSPSSLEYHSHTGDPETLTFTDEGLSVGTFYYGVAAVNQYGTGEISDAVSVVIGPFYEDFEDGPSSLSDWTTVVNGNGVLEVIADPGYESLYSLHISGTGTSTTRATSPAITDWDSYYGYTVTMKYYVANPKWIVVYDDSRVTIETKLDGLEAHMYAQIPYDPYWVDLGAVTINEWHAIEIVVYPYPSAVYFVYIDGEERGSGIPLLNSAPGYNTFTVGSRDPAGSMDMWNAYWDNILVHQEL